MPTRFNTFTNNFDLVNDLDAVVVGPGVSTDNAVVRFDGTTGKLIQNSGTILSDTDVLTTNELILTTDLAVSHGGSGRSSSTAYAVICGGTSSTDPHQSIASVGTSGQVLTSNGAGALPTFQAAAGGASIVEHVFQASDFELNETDFADLLLQSGTNVKRKVLAFANATDDQEEFANFVDHVPGDIDTTGNVTIRLYVMAATAAASKNVEFRLSYIPLNDGEDFDVAYTTVDSGDVAIDATQDNQTELTFTFAASTLAANDQFEAMISRIAASANDLTGDAYVRSMSIEYPI